MSEFKIYHRHILNKYTSQSGYKFITYPIINGMKFEKNTKGFYVTKNEWNPSITAEKKKQVGCFYYVMKDNKGSILNHGDTKILSRLGNYHCCQFDNDFKFKSTAKSNGKGNVSKNKWMVDEILTKNNNITIQGYEFTPIYGGKNQPYFPPLQENNQSAEIDMNRFFKNMFGALPKWNEKEIETELW